MSQTEDRNIDVQVTVKKKLGFSRVNGHPLTPMQDKYRLYTLSRSSWATGFYLSSNVLATAELLLQIDDELPSVC